MTIYENNFEHLFDELRRIDLIINLHLGKWRAEHSDGAHDFHGLYISEEEVDIILQNPPYGLKMDVRPVIELEKIEAVSKEIERKKHESIEQRKELRLHILSQRFHLQPFEVDAFLICLAPELELRYEKLYSYLQNDVTKKRPTVDLVIRLLCTTIEERYKARERFLPNAPLIKNRLIYLVGDGQENQIPLLSKSVKVDERIISFLLGNDEIDQKLKKFSIIIEPERSFNDLIIIEDAKKTLIELTRGICSSSSNPPPIFFFHGPYGTGKKMAAAAVNRELGTSMLVVNSKALVKGDCLETLTLILREALLQDSSVYLEGFEVLWNEKETEADVASIVQRLDIFPNMVFLSSEQPWEPSEALKNRSFINIAFSLPTFEFRKKMWKSFLNGALSDGTNIVTLANKFKFSGGQIRDAIFTARNIATAKGISELSMDELYQGCKAQSNRNLSAFARKIEPHYTWEDIILPKDTKEQLKEVCGYIKHRGTVYTDWGFDRKLSLGKGLNVLFSGPSGTGKTMAAEIIARDAGLDIYKIDLSCVVSKYIGETEKNLNNIFKEAETSNAILFFDEADALFGKRSEVRDSHDRYANIEINYLLQRLEEYEGTVILASNFCNNIDEAFLRRMHFKIDFVLPDEKLRKEIWRHIFPGETPVGNDIDFDFLANFKITGGNIKNIALNAAFLAAGNSGVVKMEHIIRGMRREFQKMGKLCVKGDFGIYYKLIEGD